MVQMKDILCVSIKNILYILYIPHGSDESVFLSDTTSQPSHLYIPHGSDERKISSKQWNSLKKLYIPHGSDESLS